MKSIAPAVVLLAVFGLAMAQSGDTLTLDECLRRGLEAGEGLRAKRLSALAAQSDARAFSAQRKPSLALKGSYAYTSETQELGSLFPALPGYTPPTIKFGDGNIYDVNATATIPLYAGGALISRERASLLDEQAQLFELQADSLTLLFNIRRAFFLAAGAQANLAAAEARSARLARHLAELSSAQQLGAATEDARLAVEASCKAADAAVIQAAAAVANARLQLGKLLGSPAEQVVPRDELDLSIAEVTSIGTDPHASRPELKTLDARIAQRHRLERANRAALLPSLAATAVYHYAKPGVDMISNEWMDYYTFGVSASWTLWDFNEARSKMKSQRYFARSLGAARQETLRSLQTRLNAAENTLAAAQPAADKLRERYALETQRAELVKQRFAAGLASESQWLDAQDDLTAAESEWISSVVALRLSEADYLYALGR